MKWDERYVWDRSGRHFDAMAVFTAYGWPSYLTDDELLAKLLALNLSRASA